MPSDKSKFYCDHCNALVPFNAEVCPSCGRQFAAVRCPDCGFTGKEELFIEGCPECGYSSSPASISTEISKSASNKQSKIKTEKRNTHALPTGIVLGSLFFILIIFLVIFFWRLL